MGLLGALSRWRLSVGRYAHVALITIERVLFVAFVPDSALWEKGCRLPMQASAPRYLSSENSEEVVAFYKSVSRKQSPLTAKCRTQAQALLDSQGTGRSQQHQSSSFQDLG